MNSNLPDDVTPTMLDRLDGPGCVFCEDRTAMTCDVCDTVLCDREGCEQRHHDTTGHWPTE